MADYKILEKIGQGGMGVVYRALQVSLNRMVAVKFLDGLNVNSTDRGRFEREIEACTKLQHPNIIKIIDSGITDNRFFYVMEYIRADTLHTILEPKQPLGLRESISIIYQLLDALAFCHDAGFIHRDVKPGNIMLSKHGHLTLMDFGLVKSQDRSILTEPGKVLGTPFYFPPELMEGEDLGPQADVWAAGVIFFQLLSGRRPFEAPDIPALARSIMNDEVPNILDLRKDLPKAHADFLHRMLAKPVKERYPDARQALNALRELEGESVEIHSRMIGRPTQKVAPKKKTGLREIPASEMPPTEVRGRPPTARGRGMAVLGAGIAALFLSILLFLVRRSSPGGESVKLKVEEFPGALRVVWSSAEPYRGKLRTVSPLPAESAGATPATTTAEWEEPAATLDHALWARPLLTKDDVELVVFGGGGEELGRLRVRPRPLEEAGARFQQKLDSFGPEQMLLRLYEEVRQLPLQELPVDDTSRYGPRLEKLVAQWMSKVEGTQRRLDLALATDEFASVKDAYFASPAPAAAKNRLVMTLSRFRVLEANLKKLGGTPDFVVNRGSTPHHGPVLATFEGQAKVVLVPIQEEPRRRHLSLFPGDTCTIAKAAFEDDVYLVDMNSIHRDQKFAVQNFSDVSRGGTTRSRIDHPATIQLPAIDTIESLDVALVGGIEVDQSVRVDYNPSNDAWEPLALFQGRGRSTELSWYRIDPRVISSSSFFIRVAIEAHPPQDARLVHPKGVAFRFRTRQDTR